MSTTTSNAASKSNPPTKIENPPKKRGRPTVFNHQKRHEFCMMIHLGCSVRAAASHLGIDKKSVEYARRHDTGFDSEVRLAERTRNLGALQNVISAGERSWRAARGCSAPSSPSFTISADAALPPRPGSIKNV